MKPSNYHILVVDDDEGIRNLIVTLLSTPGHRCVAAMDGKEALDKAGKNRFDAVIADIVMPGMDGITLTRELSKRYRDLPVMIMTGYGDQYSPAAAVAAGAREFIEKPFPVVEFTVRFHKMMREHESLCGIVAEKNERIFNLQREITEKTERVQRKKDLADELTSIEEFLNSPTSLGETMSS